jgi:hypothetical protein
MVGVPLSAPIYGTFLKMKPITKRSHNFEFVISESSELENDVED